MKIFLYIYLSFDMWTPIENILPRLLNFLIMWTVIAAIPLKRYWDVRFSPLWTMISPFNSLNEMVRKGFSLVSRRTKFWIFIQFFRKPFLSTPPDQSFFFVFLSLIVWLEKNAKPSLLMTKSSFSSETSYGTTEICFIDFSTKEFAIARMTLE